MSRKKILIFTTGFGDGHNSAARNIRDVFDAMTGFDAEVHDPYVEANPQAAKKEADALVTAAKDPLQKKLTKVAADKLLKEADKKATEAKGDGYKLADQTEAKGNQKADQLESTVNDKADQVELAAKNRTDEITKQAKAKADAATK